MKKQKVVKTEAKQMSAEKKAAKKQPIKKGCQ